MKKSPLMRAVEILLSFSSSSILIIPLGALNSEYGVQPPL
jgi:hypothetical protein